MALFAGKGVAGATNPVRRDSAELFNPSMLLLDATLGIDSAHVTTVRPPAPVGRLSARTTATVAGRERGNINSFQLAASSSP